MRGLGAAPPADQVQSVTIDIVTATGAVVGTFTTAIADVWGKKLSLTFPPATPDDAAVIASYGGLFNTPPYLIRLKPVFSLDDQPVAEGIGIAAGAALDMNLTFRQPNVADDAAHHQVVAGETHALVLDAGAFPDSLVQSRIERLKALTAANANEDAIRSEQLHLVGLRYMQHVDDGIAFATGVRWQRAVKRVFEADVRRQIDIAYNVAGAPMRLKPAENNIDVARLVVGIIPITSDQSNKAEALALAGLQSSYLEGSIWEEMNSMQGISAAKALLLARAQGQQLHTVTASNVDAVLNAVTLGAEVEAEIRGSVAQGRVAKIPSAEITLGRWTGTGYILQDPRTGAATYPISGGLAGGSTVGEVVSTIVSVLGSESWIQGSPLGTMLQQFLALILGSMANDGPSTTQSDPVNMSSGNMYRTWNDAMIPARGMPVMLTRTYNSRSSYDGPFGYGWTWSYGEQLIPTGDGSVTYREADGTEHLFATGPAGTYVAPAGKHLELIQSGSGWTMTQKDGMRFTFDTAGMLRSQTDLNSNTITINRDPSGNATSVVDATGRTALSFTWTDGRITSVADLGSRTLAYEYSGSDLVAVTDFAGKRITMEYDLAHNMTRLVGPVGNAQSYDYDTEDRLFRHVDAAGAEEFFHYDLAGRQSVVTDRRGGDRYLQFDSLGRATMEADPAGNVKTATFDAANNRTALIDARGNRTSWEYDATGNVTKEVAPDGGTTTTTYGAYSRPLAVVDASGLTTSRTYDSQGNVTEIRLTGNGVNEVTLNGYTSNGQLASVTEPNGATSSFAWNANGTLASRTDGANQTSVTATDALGRITSIKDAGGNTTTLAYDAADRVVSITDTFGASTTLGYDDAGRRTSIASARGTTTYTYDGEGRVTAMRDPAGNVIRTTYNAAGDILTRTDARGNITRYEYDSVGRVTRMTDANGGVWSYGYCASIGAGCSSCSSGGASYCELTDPNGKVLKRAFDSLGRVISTLDSLGNKTETGYDPLGRKTLEKDGNGNITKYDYDARGRLVAITDPLGAVTRFTYDGNGNKLTQKDPNGNTWSFKYDVLNRLTEESDPRGRKTVYTYDAAGNMATKTDPKGQLTTFEYNGRRLTKVTYPGNVGESFTYDAAGRRLTAANPDVTLTYSYDVNDRVTSVRRQNAQYNLLFTYEYDSAGNLARMKTPHSATAVAYAYDAKNRMTQITDPTFGSFRFTYDAMDRRTKLEYPNGVTAAYSYDAAYRLIAIASKNAAGAVVDAWSYQYDSVGNRTSKTDMDGRTEMYTYDAASRLTQARYVDGTTESFKYDPAGNRTEQVTGTGAAIAYSYDISNRLTQAGADTFTYDANGNLVTKSTSRGTTTFTYDAADRLRTISGPDGSETNIYDADGRRIDLAGTPIENGRVRVFHDLSDNPVLDWGTDNQTWTYRVYGPGQDETLAEYRRTNNRKTYLHHDALGSVTAVSRDDGTTAYRTTYRAFGQASRTLYDVPSTRMGFTGREGSVGTLMQYRSRHYDVDTGRFTQQDSFRGVDAVPASLHRYVYVANNPIRYVDPTGHAFFDCTGMNVNGGHVAIAVISLVIGVAAIVVALMIGTTVVGGIYGIALAALAVILALCAALSGFGVNWLGIIAAVLGLIVAVLALFALSPALGVLAGIILVLVGVYFDIWTIYCWKVNPQNPEDDVIDIENA